MDKPEYENNVCICPLCNELENVALILDETGILWCSCGAVIKILSLHKWELKEYKILDKYF